MRGNIDAYIYKLSTVALFFPIGLLTFHIGLLYL